MADSVVKMLSIKRKIWARYDKWLVAIVNFLYDAQELLSAFLELINY